MQTTWDKVDEYFVEHLSLSDDVLDAALRDSTAAGLPAINVTPAQGKFLAFLANMCRARRILEIGTLGGYSTIWMARALPADGTLITLEIDPNAAAVAERNLERAGVARRAKVIVGRAAESLSRLIADKVKPFDLVFIDADKQNSTVYFEATLALSHPGTVIIVDNVVREGAITDEFSTDTNVLGMRQLTEWLANESRVSATAIQTVGSKGYDGFIMALVNP
jgi:predicted O-methyltransferase YrrM